MSNHELTKCSDTGCRRRVSTHLNRRMFAVGWFFEHDGAVWCPDHLPVELAEFVAGNRDAEGWALTDD